MIPANVRQAAATLVVGTLIGAGCGPDNRPRNVVVVSFDTVRRDHLPTYGYDRDTAPRLDALAANSLVFDAAFAQETNTNPSHTSMFTGVYPHVHGNTANGVRLADEQITLAGILSDAGFGTAAFVSGATMRDAATGLSRGFDVYEDDFRGLRREGAKTTELAVEWLRDRSRAEPFFLFVHLYDAHGPYEPRDEYSALFHSTGPGPHVSRIPDYQQAFETDGSPRQNLHWYLDRYDRAIRQADDCLASVLDAVNLKETLVVVLADHGETLNERYSAFGHGGAVYDEQTRIPLVIYVPGTKAARSTAFVETVDLLPTVLDLVNVPCPPARGVQGRSLVRPESPGEPPRENVFASARAGSHYADRDYRLDRSRRMHSVRDDRWKLLQLPGPDTDYIELYDLSVGEVHNVAAEHPEVASAYLARLRSWESTEAPAHEPAEVDSLVLRQLESLGYVD